MRTLVFLFAALAGLSALTVPAAAEPGRDQGSLRGAVREGQVRPIREIEGRVLPMMRGMQYLGPEFDSSAMAYRLKFIRDGRVVFVDVDGRSGAIIAQRR